MILLFHIFVKNQSVSLFLKETQGSKCVVLTIRLRKMWEAGRSASGGASDAV